MLDLGDVVIVDYIIVTETFVLFVAVYFLFKYGLIVRKLVNQQSDVSDIIRPVMSSLDKKIDWYNEKILDLLYRVDLLETQRRVSSELVISQMSTDNEQNKHVSNDHQNISGMEITILQLLREGAKSSIEIQKKLGKSREHVARVMKQMYEVGYINRDMSKKPFSYTLSELGNSLITVAS